MPATIPPKLCRGDTVRVVAPAISRTVVVEHDHRDVIERRFAELGLVIGYGEHVDERDEFDSSSVAHRLADLHAAFADDGVAMVLTVLGGFNSNELLTGLDFELIRAHPKILCGFSDITALQAAILARADLVTYSGPHWAEFGMVQHFEQTRRWFVEALFDGAPLALRPAGAWTDDLWFLDQDRREVFPGDGWWPLRPGAARGRVVGGSLCTLNLLQGTPFMPSLAGALLFLEDDAESHPRAFCRDLVSLLQQPDAAGVRGIVVARFQRASGMGRDLLAAVVDRALAVTGVRPDLPVLANVEVGHTNPHATVPIGGEAEVEVAEQASRLVFVRH